MLLASEHDRGSAKAASLPYAAPPRSPAAAPLPRRFWLFVVALSIALLIVYQPIWNGGFLWDDAAHVTRPDLRSWQGLWSIWSAPGATQQYYPLTHTFFWVQHRLWGDTPSGYHLVNIALHAAAVSMVGLILYRLAIPGAYFAAAIFALHPIQVESVAWITEIKNTLSAVFYLGAAIAWLRYRDNANASAYALSLGLFVLALCSKTVTATLPAALLVIEWWRRGRLSWRRDVLPLIPFFILGVAAGLSTAWIERTLVGAEGAAFDLTPIERGLIAGRALWFYAGKLLWPVNLVFIYPRWNVSQVTWWQYVYPAAAIVVLAVAWGLRRRWRGPLAGMLYFAGTLFPALGFFNVYPFLFSFVADHFQYLASLGLITLAAAGLARVLEQWRLWGSAAANVACVALLSTLAVLTWKQSHVYADVESLYRATIEGNPESWMAHNNLAGALIARGAVDEAARHAEIALALRPDYAEARNNLGLVLASHGRIDEALGQYRQALGIQPDYAEAHNNLGFLLARRGQVDEAIAHYRRALEIDPGLAGAHYNFAEALTARGQIDDAVAHLRMTLALRPEYAGAHNSLGVILAERGKVDEARDQFLKAVEIKPQYADAHNNLGIVLARSGRLEEAITHFQKALEINPASTEIRNNLRAALATRKRSLNADQSGSR
jgi:tetratricopeptide (TPR) repeat protein